MVNGLENSFDKMNDDVETEQTKMENQGRSHVLPTHLQVVSYDVLEARRLTESLQSWMGLMRTLKCKSPQICK